MSKFSSTKATIFLRRAGIPDVLGLQVAMDKAGLDERLEGLEDYRIRCRTVAPSSHAGFKVIGKNGLPDPFTFQESFVVKAVALVPAADRRAKKMRVQGLFLFQKRQQGEHQEQDKADLGNQRGGAGERSKTENCGDQSDDNEDDGVVKHWSGDGLGAMVSRLAI
jgi:hypothetical protein